ncbi:SAM-dependent methyltransferase [Nonomuraea sp. NPDC049309]|uniref:SAM-dependent methyltransferase n=1 Tax=Nonomuraea sp. NPDC049309 TaxID=3364350 RepID=UPI00372264F5
MSSPLEVDASKPSSARIYDYFLGGCDHYAVDREAAKTFLLAVPNARNAARATRGFVLRSTRAIAEMGIRQFIDIGCGIPIYPNVHDIARKVNPDARVVYVDNDPIVLAKGRALRDEPGVVTVEGDLRKPAEIFANPEVTGLLDLNRPIGVLTIAVWHFLPEDEIYDYQAQIRQALAPGSCLALAHGCMDYATKEEVASAHALYQHTTNPMRVRTREEIARLFEGFELIEPGLVPLNDWRPRKDDPYPEKSTELIAGVGVLRAR